MVCGEANCTIDLCIPGSMHEMLKRESLCCRCDRCAEMLSAKWKRMFPPSLKQELKSLWRLAWPTVKKSLVVGNVQQVCTTI